jgi:hypothetical protein
MVVGFRRGMARRQSLELQAGLRRAGRWRNRFPAHPVPDGASYRTAELKRND